MKELASVYILLPIVYFMYRAGELAREKGHSPFKWQFFTYLTTIMIGFVTGFLIILAGVLAESTMSKTSLAVFATIGFVFSVIASGFFLLSRLKQRRTLSSPKRTYRAYDFKNAFLFPRVIPRGGFLWRSIAYKILFTIIPWLLALPVLIGKESLAKLPWVLLIPGVCFFVFIVLGITCIGILYFISYICIPRIRDAGLSRDTLIMLFLPVFNFVAFFQLLLTPTRMSGRSSI